MPERLIKQTHLFIEGYYNLLLLSLFLLFIMRPYGRGPIYHDIWKLLLAAVLLTAIFNCKHSSKVKITASALSIPIVALSWINEVEHLESLFVINAFLTVVFISICTASILYDVILRARVTPETLKGVVCAYFMIAFGFAYVYYLIEYLVPGTFYFADRLVLPIFFTQYLSELLYYSFVTLLTIGYGDITAVKDIGQTASVIEGILGQFYIAILVSRLVAVYSFYSNNKLLRTLEKDIDQIKR